MGCLLEIVGEIFLEIYMELAALLVSEDKMSPKLTAVLKVVAGIVALVLLGMFVVGIVLIVDGDSLGTGVLLLVLSVLIFIALIVLAIVSRIKRNR